MKEKISFVCNNCGSAFSSWFGRCPDCSEWGTLSEFRQKDETEKKSFVKAKFLPLCSQKSTAGQTKLSSGFKELDRVLGGGFVEDEVVLLAGEPGVGKSTLLLSVLARLKKGGLTVYVSSEEDQAQIQQRANRLGVQGKNILFSSDKNIDSLLAGLEELVKKQKISLAVFDSLQGIYSSSNSSVLGSIAQAKEVLLKIVQFAKKNSVAALVIGHITKSGEIAGPKFLEHMVDAVLYLEGEKMTSLRLLRALKNRFGGTDEIGFFEVVEAGIKEVVNPSSYFLEVAEEAVGKASVGTRQGMRIVFATIESLVVSSSLAFPKRVAKGVDAKRLELILAILKKYLHLPVDKFDIYVSVAGGLKIDDPLADLGIAAALYSSLTNKAFSPHELFLGEVGLLGNIRKHSALASVIKEAKRLGFKKIYQAANMPSIGLLKQI